MKLSGISKSLFLGAALLLATSSFASNRGGMELMSSATVNGTAIPAGTYSLKWEGNGANVELSIMKGSKVVATTPARLIDLNQSSTGDSAVLRDNGGGSKSLVEVHFAGKKYALAIGGDSASNQGDSTK